ncbi:hypothetical protein [Alkalibacillus salilacus]|uniref:Cytochrome c oxidase assembly protein n=1 Tax=Alkalibacillus salilacus TaxID=284582 RepID=A0ABT9VBE8_9BACI|nr:hypothetical protein [Alkalibacillus salilacus]MDQ0158266.1 hypothetical protein [Alkalibacillus salilacus]
MQSLIGLLLWIFLFLPPVRDFLESMMILHMHMQMPLIILAGFLMAKPIIKRFSSFFEKWNEDGLPGIVLFVLILGYWMIPRTMDDALLSVNVELFKFINLAFLAGVPLRDSFPKLSTTIKHSILLILFIMVTSVGSLYIFSDSQLCNNYLQVEQLTLGWSFLIMGFAITGYLAYVWLFDPDAYE